MMWFAITGWVVAILTVVISYVREYYWSTRARTLLEVNDSLRRSYGVSERRVAELEAAADAAVRMFQEMMADD